MLFTTCDFAFLYHIAELEVAHRFNLPMVKRRNCVRHSWRFPPVLAWRTLTSVLPN